MTETKRISPSRLTEADVKQAGGLDSKISENQPHARIGATVEKALDATLWRLVTGEIGLQDCTSAIVGLYAIGFEHGRQSVLPLLERAQDERDRYYERWQNPGKELTDMRLRRMRENAADYWEQFVRNGGAL